MSRPLVVLMYHSLYASERELLETVAPVDRPYAVSTQAFEQQLDWLAQAQVPVHAPHQWPQALALGGVILTFDDGHVSNHAHAREILLRRGLPALFFVTTEFIGQREHFCSWAQLREMADAGLEIGGHGHTHRFFDDLPEAVAREEFTVSHDRIAQALGRPVTQMSFPGGRYRPDQLAWGREAGYRVFHTSRVGAVPADFAAALQQGEQGVPRYAMRASTRAHTFAAIASGSRPAMAWAQGVAAAKYAVRRLAGNGLYKKAYDALAR